MIASKVLVVVRREMTKYAYAWRMDWSDFDGRTLRDQMESLDAWAEQALKGETNKEFTGGTEFLNNH